MAQISNLKDMAAYQEGMYLSFADGTQLDLSKERVLRLTQEYWNDPAKLPLYIRKRCFQSLFYLPFKDKEVFAPP
ncbi:MAG: hypothetical protein L7F78_05470 [Syntrophales bacterium LBB04]|nr:hypothetical protein [Syntrophales bacterium LBB04]